MDIQAHIQSGIIESYVLGLASAEEVTEVETLRLQHPEIEQAIDDFSILIEEQVFANPIAPPLELKGKIMDAIKEEKEQTPVIPISQNSNSTGAKRFDWKMLAAASVILFIASAALNFYLYNQYNQKNTAYQALLTERNTLQANNQIYQTRLNEWKTAAEVLADPAMVRVKMPGIKGKEQNQATVFWNAKNKEVYLMPDKLPHPVAGKQFQLWALVDGKPVDAGILDISCTGVCRMKNIPKAQAFAITLENEGGSPTPTMEAMYVMGKV